MASVHFPAAHPPRRGRLACARDLEAESRAALYSLQNPSFLQAVRNELKSHNPDGSGLVTLDRFNEALSHMGVAFGSPELDRILQFCDLTADGFVLFKSLLLETAPFRRQTVDSVRDAIAPPDPHEGKPLFPAKVAESAARLFPPESGRFTAEQGACARRLFSLWERSLLRDFQLKEALRQAGFRVGPEFERLLSLRGPSGSVSFGAFLRALMAHSPQPFSKAGASLSNAALCSATSTSGQQTRGGGMQEPQRDVVAWREGAEEAAAGPAAKASWTDKAVETLRGKERQDFFKRLVALFLESSLDGESFRWFLQRAGVVVGPSLDASIRRQEASGEVSFAHLLALVLREDAQDHAEGQQGPPSDEGATLAKTLPRGAEDSHGR